MPPKRAAAKQAGKPKRRKEEDSESESADSGSESDGDFGAKRAPAKRGAAKRAAPKRGKKAQDSSDEAVQASKKSQSESEANADADAGAKTKARGGARPERQVQKTLAKQKEEAANPAFGLRWHVAGPKDTLLYLTSDECKPNTKIAAFDMDDTLVRPKSGKKFSESRGDWVWWHESVPAKLREFHENGYNIVIISNQAGVEKGKVKPENVKGKILDLSKELGFPLQALLAIATDNYRKPHDSMWRFYVESMNANVEADPKFSLYVGDAAGRLAGWKAGVKKDFSCSDRIFALNSGLSFKTPDEFFLDEAPTDKFDWDSIDPTQILAKSPKKPIEIETSASQEMVLLVGCPASGKSTLARRVFIPAGYVHVNNDTLGTKPKSMKVTKEAIANKQSVVIDNTNPSKAVRAEYIAIAKAAGIPVRLFVLDTPVEIAHHNNFYREVYTNGEVRRVPDVGYNVYKKNYEEPSAGEGIAQIVHVPFVPVFETEHHRKLFLQRTG